jgi:hypothetical protein
VVAPELSGYSIVFPDLVGKDNPLWWASSAVVGQRFVARFAWSRPAALRVAHEIGVLTALARGPGVPFLPEAVASSTDPLLLVTRRVPGRHCSMSSTRSTGTAPAGNWRGFWRLCTSQRHASASRAPSARSPTRSYHQPRTGLARPVRDVGSAGPEASSRNRPLPEQLPPNGLVYRPPRSTADDPQPHRVQTTSVIRARDYGHRQVPIPVSDSPSWSGTPVASANRQLGPGWPAPAERNPVILAPGELIAILAQRQAPAVGSLSRRDHRSSGTGSARPRPALGRSSGRSRRESGSPRPAARGNPSL